MPKYNLYPYQEDGVKMMHEMKRCLCGDDMGTGKEQPVDAIVKTPSGDKRIGDINIGDYVFSRDGKSHQVTGVFPQGIKPVYKMTFSDGVTTECGLEHLWTVRDHNRIRRGTGWTIKTTQELIISGIYLRNNVKHCKWFIPMCEPVEYEEKGYVIHPYLLGVLIGDGCLLDGCVFSNPETDKDIRYKISQQILSEDYCLTRHETTSCPQFRIVCRYGNRTNKYNREIVRLKLDVHSGEKFIPEEYFFGSVEQRKELLYGLMDTDGSVRKGNRIDFATSSEKLAYDIQRLVWSLGGQAIVRKYIRKRNGSVEFHVNVRTSFNPFWTHRKHFARNIKTKIFPTRGIKSIDYIGEKECVCIMVDEPEHTYLTDSFIVTHNTGSSIVAIERVKATPCLVICPSALKINWKREVENFTNLRPLILTDTNREAFPYYIGQLDLYDVVICNYESLQKYFIKDLGPKPLKLANFVFSPVVNMLKSVIIDESARVKDPSTRQSKIVMGLCQGKEYVIELSGTPVVNNTQDLACQIAILGRIGEFGGYKAFMERYGEGDHLRELHDIIHQKMYFRREKSEVLKDLPELTRTLLSCDLDKVTMEEYYTCLHDLQEYLKEYRDMTDAQAKRRMRMRALVRFMHLRAISGRGKTKAVIEMLYDNPNTQFIVFCEHHDVVDELYANFEGEVVTVTGRDSVMQKQAAIDSFQAGTSRIIVCSIRAAGVGLTLTAASNVIFTELPWTYSDLSQCEARAYRNGQKNAVNSIILMGNNTIDGRLYEKIMDKRSLLNQITGAEDGAAFENEASFDELIDIL